MWATWLADPFWFYIPFNVLGHYSDITISTMAFQIAGVSIVYSTVYSGSDQRKYIKLRVTGLCDGNSPMTGEFPTQRAGNAENVSIWWRHHGKTLSRHNISKELCTIYTYCCILFLFGIHATGTNGNWHWPMSINQLLNTPKYKWSAQALALTHWGRDKMAAVSQTTL